MDICEGLLKDEDAISSHPRGRWTNHFSLTMGSATWVVFSCLSPPLFFHWVAEVSDRNSPFPFRDRGQEIWTPWQITSDICAHYWGYWALNPRSKWKGGTIKVEVVTRCMHCCQKSLASTKVSFLKDVESMNPLHASYSPTFGRNGLGDKLRRLLKAP